MQKRARQTFSIFCAGTIALIVSFLIIKEKEVLGDWANQAWVAPVASVSLFIIAFLVVQFLILRFLGHKVFPDEPDVVLSKDTVEDESVNEKIYSDSNGNEAFASPEFEDEKNVFLENLRKQPAQKMFVPMMVITAVSVAFAHGSNDIGNAIGPFGVIYDFWKEGNYFKNEEIPWWLFLLAGFAIVAGLATLGYRVIATVGEKIVPLTYSKGYSAELATSTTVLTATLLGIPISTTHTLVGSVTGTSLTKMDDFRRIQWKTILKIFISWGLTFVAGSGVTLILYVSFKGIFLI